jgi:hypothetical protein
VTARIRGALRLAAIAGAGAALVALLSALLLLYLHVPLGESPLTGWAPRIGPVFLKAFPYPSLELRLPIFRAVSVALVLATWILYGGAAYWTARLQDARERRRVLGVIVAVALVAHVLLVLLPPALSTDLYRYGLFGKMILMGDNPYLLPADALAGDSLWPYAGWTHLRSHYGPTFLWVATGATRLGGGGPIGTALALKAVVAVFNLIACWTVRALARLKEDDDGLTALALYAWNPLVLLEGPGQAHPEGVMMALALLGVLLWWQGRPLTGFALLLASAAVKYVTGVLVLLAAVKMVSEAEPRRRLGLVARLLGVSALVAVGLYAPFWGGGAVFDQAVEVIVKGSSLDRASYAAPPATPVLALIIFAVALGAAIPLAWRLARPYVLDLSAAVVSLFVLLVLYWTMPWYFITAIAMTVAGGPSRSNRPLILVALFLGLLSMLRYCTLVSVGKP